MTVRDPPYLKLAENLVLPLDAVTQTFAVVLRVRADAPTRTLADTVGAPTLAFQTEAFF